MEHSEKNQIKVSRTFDAPLEKLWQAWTEPEHFKQWYGPEGFTVPVCEIDLKVGGRRFWGMQSPDGMHMFTVGSYLEIVPMERLVYSDSMADAEGNVVSPERMGMPAGSPSSMDVTVTFVHEAGKTTVTVSHVSHGESDRAGSGWEQAFEKLALFLE